MKDHMADILADVQNATSIAGVNQVVERVEFRVSTGELKLDRASLGTLLRAVDKGCEKLTPLEPRQNVGRAKNKIKARIHGLGVLCNQQCPEHNLGLAAAPPAG